ncbi:26S proteasome regulatory subunit [Lunasporangiospora selenospora]|uniref:26S proteasome regulatory subunit n=1 Tax=Lunasporangiospora selenospora TaxID=979761 RepID=A0A9P6KEN2_9FUNG|nr:26S proteasome regulatory subunit [Lunasporangiospora selenospora]
MEVDSDIPNFLATQKQQAPASLQGYYGTFEDLYERKLWHQLTLAVEDFVSKPESGPLQVALYRSFISDWESKMSQLKLVSLGVSAAKQLSDHKEAREFLKSLTEKVDTDETRDAYVLARMEATHFGLILGDLETTKKDMDDCSKLLDGFDSVDPHINASFLRVSADYYKIKAEYAKYYKSALLYLACINIDELSNAEKTSRANDLALSALLGDSIYNFGELLMHPILESLVGTDREWLKNLLFAFNSGDIGKFEALAPHFSQENILQSNMTALRQKICLMSLTETVFKRNSDNRTIAFSTISTETKLPLEEVEILAMKALSLGLIKGTIDQVDEVVRVNWVQPRVLDRNQIQGMQQRLQEWTENVNKTALVMETEAIDVYA